MNTLTDRLRKANFTDRIFDERQLGKVLSGGAARRYSLVNRALKDGSLLRLKRGLYTLSPAFRSEAIHPFTLAQGLQPGSYISFETALSYHGWIPEAVYTTASVTPERKSLAYDSGALGQFSYHPLALQDFQFLTGVERKKFGLLTGFVATPLRALMDLVAQRKLTWSGLSFITEGLRIEEALLLTLEDTDFSDIRQVYKHKTVNAFIDAFQSEVRRLKSSREPSE